MSCSTVRTQPNVGTQVNSTALANALMVTASAGTLLSFVVTNTGAAQFIQVHDAAAATANGTVPIAVFAVPDGSTTPVTASLDIPIKCTNGVYLCNSSTAATRTVGSANCWFLARYL